MATRSGCHWSTDRKESGFLSLSEAKKRIHYVINNWKEVEIEDITIQQLIDRVHATMPSNLQSHPVLAEFSKTIKARAIAGFNVKNLLGAVTKLYSEIDITQAHARKLPDSYKLEKATSEILTLVLKLCAVFKISATDLIHNVHWELQEKERRIKERSERK